MAASFKLFGFELSTVNWNFVIYTLLSVAIVAMGTAKLFSMGPPTAIIYAIGSVMVFIFYGYRWFGANSNKKSDTWPPTLNTCPDYLTYIKTLPGDSKPGCVDMLGVGTLTLVKTLESDLTAAGALQSTNQTKVFGFTSADILSGTDVRLICNRCRTLGITWEGVYDGDGCVGAATNSAAQSNPPGSSCPS